MPKMSESQQKAGNSPQDMTHKTTYYVSFLLLDVGAEYFYTSCTNFSTFLIHQHPADIYRKRLCSGVISF